MTGSDLRELDGWIAEKFMGWKRNPKYDVPVWEDANGDPHWWSLAWVGADVTEQFRPSSEPTSFALVKREIERRGWEWACAYERPTEHLKSAYTFTVYVIREPETNAPICYDKLAASEELAGCLAVKAAVEGSIAH